MIRWTFTVYGRYLERINELAHGLHKTVTKQSSAWHSVKDELCDKIVWHEVLFYGIFSKKIIPIRPLF